MCFCCIIFDPIFITMNEQAGYLAVNRKLWDERTKHHVDSDFYDTASFIKGKSTLNDIELVLLGDVRGKSILHLQCHFGQDTLSLARMGAKVTGVDFSTEAINKARALNEELNLDAQFVCTDIYELPGVLQEQFDIVFTSYGTIGWLPDMAKWAGIVSQYMKQGGKFLIAEFHPVVWMFDNDLKEIKFSYFNKEVIEEVEYGTYADKDAPIVMDCISWNHDLAEVMQSLINAGLRVTSFNEYDYSPYNCFNNVIEVAPGKYQVKGMEGKLPMVYAIGADKP